jgi:adenosylmethionine-8-amino-7-oxononanoate aminotransferase
MSWTRFVTRNGLRGFVAPGLWEAGVYCRADDRGQAVVQFAPSLTCGQAEFHQIESAMRSVLKDAWTRL